MAATGGGDRHENWVASQSQANSFSVRLVVGYQAKLFHPAFRWLRLTSVKRLRTFMSFLAACVGLRLVLARETCAAATCALVRIYGLQKLAVVRRSWSPKRRNPSVVPGRAGPTTR